MKRYLLSAMRVFGAKRLLSKNSEITTVVAVSPERGITVASEDPTDTAP